MPEMQKLVAVKFGDLFQGIVADAQAEQVGMDSESEPGANRIQDESQGSAQEE
ncbi:MAG: hypothetical protein AB1894_04825 [Chloroflexota bacterium]